MTEHEAKPPLTSPLAGDLNTDPELRRQAEEVLADWAAEDPEVGEWVKNNV